MTPTKKELIEKMARGIFLAERGLSLQEELGVGLSWEDAKSRRSQSPTCAALIDLAIDCATAALTAIESAGLAVVPREATAEMLAHALPSVDDEHSDADKKLGAAACLLLSGGRDIPNEGQAVPVAAGLAEDYRSMVEHGRVK